MKPLFFLVNKFNEVIVYFLFKVKQIFKSETDTYLNHRNWDVINRASKEYGYSKHQSEQYFVSFLNYMKYAHSFKAGELAPSRDIDNIWHTYLLYSIEYSKFCRNFFGQFIYHVPLSVNTESSIDFKNRFIFKNDGTVLMGGGVGDTCCQYYGDEKRFNRGCGCLILLPIIASVISMILILIYIIL